jgi:hypothetical protein
MPVAPSFCGLATEATVGWSKYVYWSAEDVALVPPGV